MPAIHERVARMVGEIFEKEFSRFSVEDFSKVAGILGMNVLDTKSDFKKYYENLSEDNQKQIDFMMKL
jgi:hypothetical protein